MVKIIVFKSDALGDLILFSPCLKIFKENFKDSHITLICSKVNYKIAKNYQYIDKFIILEKGIFNFFIKNFKNCFLTRYDYLFQLDGKSRSYLISYFIRSKHKSTVCFIKHKKFFKVNYKVTRPSLFMLKCFFNNFVYCDERYSLSNDKPVHYQSNYFNLLEKLDLKINSKKNIFTLDKSFEKIYEQFFHDYIDDKYLVFHFDERWENFQFQDFINSIKIIQKISLSRKVIITTGIKNFKFLDHLEKKFTVFKYENNLISVNKDNNTDQILILKGIPLNLLCYFIKNSQKNISAHSGPIVHISPAFDRIFIDIISKSKNNELDRWIPLVSKYQRINFEELNDDFINNFKF